MAWLRLDDHFSRHPKIGRMNDRQFRTWVMLLCWCADYRTGGRVDPDAASNSVVHCDNRFLEFCRANGLLDLLEDGTLMVHDWDAYNPADPTADVRMKRHRARKAAVTPTVTGTVTSHAGADARARSPLSSTEAIEPASVEERSREEQPEGGAAAAMGGSAAAPPSSSRRELPNGSPAATRSNLDTGTIREDSLDWCLTCDRQFPLAEVATGMCRECTEKAEQEAAA